jgi:hypothetical protein
MLACYARMRGFDPPAELPLLTAACALPLAAPQPPSATLSPTEPSSAGPRKPPSHKTHLQCFYCCLCLAPFPSPCTTTTLPTQNLPPPPLSRSPPPPGAHPPAVLLLLPVPCSLPRPRHPAQLTAPQQGSPCVCAGGGGQQQQAASQTEGKKGVEKTKKGVNLGVNGTQRCACGVHVAALAVVHQPPPYLLHTNTAAASTKSPPPLFRSLLRSPSPSHNHTNVTQHHKSHVELCNEVLLQTPLLPSLHLCCLPYILPPPPTHTNMPASEHWHITHILCV